MIFRQLQKYMQPEKEQRFQARIGLLAPFQEADLPERKLRFWQMVGPGAILVGLSIGAGEIIVWPRIVAEYGASMVWAAVVGVFLQLWINFEVGRWTIATGESIYTGFARAWWGFAPLFILLNILGWLAPGWGRASGLALKALLVGPTGFGSDTFWTAITFGLVALLLFGPKVIYQSVEKTIELLVVIVTVGLLLVAVAVGTGEAWAELLRGVVHVGYKNPNMTVKAFFIALVFAGAGGTANLFYTFYLRDKRIGMGARVPELLNPLRGRVEKIPSTGFRFLESAENASRFRAWFDYVKKDQVLFFFGLNSFTILLFIFGSLVVLHPAKILPEPGTLIWDQAGILGAVWGQPGRIIFLLVGVATLFSTQMALVDGVSRSIADILYVNVPAAQKRDLSWWYLLVASLWMVTGCGITYFMEAQGVSELGFLFNAGYMGGFAMAVYVPLILYINHRFLPKAARPGMVCSVAMSLATLVYVGFAVLCVVWEVQAARTPPPPGLDALVLTEETAPPGWTLQTQEEHPARLPGHLEPKLQAQLKASRLQEWKAHGRKVQLSYLAFKGLDPRVRAQNRLMSALKAPSTVAAKGNLLLVIETSESERVPEVLAAWKLQGLERIKLRPSGVAATFRWRQDETGGPVDLAEAAERYGVRIVASARQELTVADERVEVVYLEAGDETGADRIEAQEAASPNGAQVLRRDKVIILLHGSPTGLQAVIKGWEKRE